MQRKANATIDELIWEVKEELLSMDYGNHVIKRYQVAWNRLTGYMQERSMEVYNTKVGLDFLEEAYQISQFSRNCQMKIK